MPIQKKILNRGRLRRPPAQGFSWIDRRLIADGFAPDLPQHELLLYLFLCLVADQHGLSFYGDRRISEILKLSGDRLDHARRELEKRDLIVYRYPLYQVLSLPNETIGPRPDAARQSPPASRQPRRIGEILDRLH